MPLSELACEILGFFRETHRKPGARMTMATLDAHFGTDPAVAVAISELKQLGYVTAPDAGTAGAPGAGAADDSLALSSPRRSLLDVRAPQPLATSTASRPTHSGADRRNNRFPMFSP